MIYFCCDQRRRNDLAGSAFNGIDYLEVLDHEIEQSDPANRQKKLIVHFINDLAAGALDKPNIRIEGGERVPGIFAINVAVDGQDAKLLNIELNQYGDFSIYTFRLVQNPQNLAPPAIIDPMFAAVDFSFKVDCPSDFDCQPRCDCPAAPLDEPEINYLAKDYGSFRRLMLDRMTALMPQWRERNPADLGVTLVELLAYVGDHLSYQQDAVATEAYLGTARRRVSVRRHARLVDYHMHDGCNARAWVQVRLKEGAAAVSISPGATQFFTRIADQPAVLPDDPQLRAQAQAIFEPMETVSLFADHNKFELYTWSDQRCCLPKGATDATLRGFHPDLKPGHVVIFEEVLNPHTGGSEDADPKHRCAVRLVEVQARGENNQPLRDGLTNQQITQISWDDADALEFPFCVSAQTDKSHGAQFIDNVTVVRGNIVLADHGATIGGEALGSVGPALPVAPSSTGCERCAAPELEPMAPRFRPTIAHRPLTFAARHDPSGPARAAMVWSERAAEAKIKLTGVFKGDPTPWQARADLLQSRADRQPLRGRDRKRRPGAAALRRRYAGSAPQVGDQIYRRLSDRQRRRGQHRRRSAGAYSHRRSAVGRGGQRDRQSAGGPGRRRAGDHGASARLRAGSLSHAEARRHRSRLRRGCRTPSGGAAGDRDVSLDRQLAHGVYHRRSSGRCAGGWRL